MIKLGILAAVGLAATYAMVDRTPSPDVIKVQAEGYLARLGVHREVIVAIEPQSMMMREDVIAQTNIDWRGACVLHFTREALTYWRDLSVAHEAVHCALDYDALIDHSYDSDSVEREKRADRLAHELSR